jgi:shikimate dehydrogenase
MNRVDANHVTTAAPVATVPPRRLVVLGHPVSQSVSPIFQGAAIAACGLSVPYERRDVPPELLHTELAACAANGTGGNITIPHKEAVAQHATRLTEVARRAGAVNTFWFEGEALIGHNTDVQGAMATIRALGSGAAPASAVLLGAGGSAAAVLVALHLLGVTHVHIIARTPVRARELAARVQVPVQVHEVDAAAVHAVLREAALVINATPVGMRDDLMPVPVEQLGAQTAVFDLVYRQQGTAWVRAARARGLVAEDGMRMLVEQGAGAFEAWFGREAPRDVMWQALGVPMPDAFRMRP